MPTPVDHANIIPRTKTRGRKHRTKAEIDARKNAAEQLELKRPVDMNAPQHLPKDAKKIWNRKVAEIKLFKSPDTLLVQLDSDVFEAFCVNKMHFEVLAKKNGKTTNEDRNLMLRYTKTIMECADKLGFTPTSRARLIRKMASDKPNSPGMEFD